MKDSLRVAFYCGIYTCALWVVVFLKQGHQWRDDKRHRSAYLVAYVHEELYLCLAEFFLMLVFLHSHAVLLLALALLEIDAKDEINYGYIEQICHSGSIPRRVDDNGEIPCFRLLVVLYRLHPELVFSRRHVAEVYLVLSLL